MRRIGASRDTLEDAAAVFCSGVTSRGRRGVLLLLLLQGARGGQVLLQLAQKIKVSYLLVKVN
jgi:hypothetical protein